MELQRKWDIEDRDEARAYDERRTRELSRDLYSNLVTDAEAAGFNPLSALRNGGGASYGTTITSTPLSRKAPVRQAVGGSSSASAFSAAGDFLLNFDPFADQKREQEYRLIESQIASLNAGTLSRGPSVSRSTPRSYATSDYEARPSGRAASLSKGNAPGEGKIVGGDDPTASSMGLNDGRYGWFHAPWWPDAEAAETIYGDNEIFSTIGGGVKILADGSYSIYRNVYSGLEDTRAATLSLPNKQTKTQAKFLKEFNRNLDGMFGAEFKRRLKGG